MLVIRTLPPNGRSPLDRPSSKEHRQGQAVLLSRFLACLPPHASPLSRQRRALSQHPWAAGICCSYGAV